MSYGSLHSHAQPPTRDNRRFNPIDSFVRKDTKENRDSKFKQVIALVLCTVAIFAIVSSRDYIKLAKPSKLNNDEKVSFSVDDETNFKKMFNDFTILHNRDYSDTAEYDKRFDAFKSNVELINTLNNANPLAQFNVNQYADSTNEELLSRRMISDFSNIDKLIESLPSELFETIPGSSVGNQGKGVRSKTSGTNMKKSQFGWISEHDCAACDRYPDLDQYNLSNMPLEWDWRTKFETPVRDQGYCGSCWSFSTAGDIEGSWFLATGKAVELSKQQLISCDQKRGAAEGCNGGFPQAAMQYVSQVGGLVYESNYPYQSICTRNCPSSAYKAPTCYIDTITDGLMSNEVAHVGGWQMVALGPDFEGLMATALVKNGPIAIAMNAIGMEYYTGGILQSAEHCNPAELNHAVLLVGFGVEEGVPYWIVKNSWGTDWGENGYIRLLKGQNFCGVANFAVTSVVKAP